MDYYIYLYQDPRTADPIFGHEPFYVGRGKGKRCDSHLKEALKYESSRPSFDEIKSRRLNMLKINKILSIISDGQLPIIVKIKEDLTLEESKKLEIEFIKSIGRSIFGEGPLTNLTSGGEGRTVNHSGPLNPFYGKTVSDKNKKLLSEVHKGKKLSDDQKSKISAALKGKKKSLASKENMRSSLIKRLNDNPNQKMFTVLGESRQKTWVLKSPQNEIIEVVSLLKWCKSQGFSNKTLLSAYKKQQCVKNGAASGWQIISKK